MFLQRRIEMIIPVCSCTIGLVNQSCGYLTASTNSGTLK